jgi:hypothetical protein
MVMLRGALPAGVKDLVNRASPRRCAGPDRQQQAGDNQQETLVSKRRDGAIMRHLRAYGAPAKSAPARR